MYEEDNDEEEDTSEDVDSGHKCSRRDYEEDYMMTATELVTVMEMMILPRILDWSQIAAQCCHLHHVGLSACLPAY